MMVQKKSPTKAELLQLQRLYKTDEKIGERLGGVEPYLVAYWRRKKNIPKYSLPKFSEQEIQNLWERFGDDEKAGLELGISKAAFYNWRRRYGFKEKPAFLKLEQLEFNFPGARPGASGAQLYGKRTIARKIIARALDSDTVEASDEISVEPALALLTDKSAEVIKLFRESGSEIVWNPGKIVFSFRGDAKGDKEHSDDFQAAKEFARRQGIKAFYDPREGTRSQVIMERGQILPGQLLMTTDNFATPHGAVGALALGIDPDAMSRLWKSGSSTLTVPSSVQIILGGRRSRGVLAPDVALSIIHRMKDRDVEGKIIECTGSVLSQMNMNERAIHNSLCSLLGAAGMVCQYDATTRRFLSGRNDSRYAPVIPDRDAEYDSVYQLNIDGLTPQIAGPGDFTRVRPAEELQGMVVNQVIIGSCFGGRFDELRVAAEILKGKKVHPDCRLLVVPGSRTTYLEALKKGLVRVFTEAGAIIVHPAYCPCGNYDVLATGERCLSTSPPYSSMVNEANVCEWYIGSASTAAASAIEASITDPSRYSG